MPNPYNEDSTASPALKKNGIIPEQDARRRKIMVVFGAIIVVCAAVAVGVFHLIG